MFALPLQLPLPFNTDPDYEPKFVSTPVNLYTDLTLQNINMDSVDISGINTNFLAQKQMTKWLLHRILDKWLFKSEMEGLLKYLKIVDGKVVVVKDSNEKNNNLLSNETTKTIEKKADFIEGMLPIEKLKSIVMKVTSQLNIKWYDLVYPENEIIVVRVVKKHLKNKLKGLMG